MSLLEKIGREPAVAVEIRGFCSLRQAANAVNTPTDTLIRRKYELGLLTVKFAKNFDELVLRFREFSDMNVFFNYVLLNPGKSCSYTRNFELVKKHLEAHAR